MNRDEACKLIDDALSYFDGSPNFHDKQIASLLYVALRYIEASVDVIKKNIMDGVL